LIRVGVLASGLTLRLGLREVLHSLPDVEVAGDGVSLADLPTVDLLVVGSSSILGGLEDQPMPILLLTDDPMDARRMLDFPLWGTLPLDAGPDEISAALHALAEGLWVGSPSLVQSLIERRQLPDIMEEGEPVIDPLTGREQQVLQLAAEGLANKQIAVALGISDNTVKFHLASLYAKLGVTNRTEAVRAGARHGWVVL
jgi:DNA-binding NarL/FixJ family response regulator